MKIDYTSVRELRPHPNNARTHSKKQIRQLANSIAQFGFCNPVLVDDASKSSPATAAWKQPNFLASTRCRRCACRI
jgi:hypothetical protein